MCVRMFVATMALLGTAGNVDAGPSWVVNHETSHLEYAVDIGGMKTKGGFKDWSAEIDFDPKHPANGHVRVTIDVASVTIADERAKAITESAWLSVSTHPKAVFESNAFNLEANGNLNVSGRLTLKGTEMPLTLSGTLLIENGQAQADLSGVIMRLAHQIGVGQAIVSPEVVVNTTLTANLKP